MKQRIHEIMNLSKDRFDLWSGFINEFKCLEVAEVGVYLGAFAEKILSDCKHINRYVMIDPWRNLSDWKRPSNKENSEFEEYYQKTLARTSFAASKREVLRGKTTEVIAQVADDSLDFIYVDGDHTLKGIAIDLINVWQKVRSSGFVAGDDFRPAMWNPKLGMQFEPMMVFPFAVYFAEAMDVKIYALPYRQFVICKEEKGFELVDLTKGLYQNTEVRYQLKKILNAHSLTGRMKSFLVHQFPLLKKMRKR